jgi:hypothetical protein
MKSLKAVIVIKEERIVKMIPNLNLQPFRIRIRIKFLNFM